MPSYGMEWKGPDRTLPYQKEKCSNCSHERKQHNDDGCTRFDGCQGFKAPGQVSLFDAGYGIIESVTVTPTVEAPKKAKSRMSVAERAKQVYDLIHFHDNGFAFMEIYKALGLEHSLKQSLINALEYGISHDFIQFKEGRYFAVEVVAAEAPRPA